MVACYIQRAIQLGRTRLDFLRGDEPYKYEWGAVDSPIERLLVQRTGRRPGEGALRWAPTTAWVEPCADPEADRQPIEGGRVRVVEVMATGTNGGAQEHVYSLVTRLNPSLLRRSRRLALARQQRPPPGEGRHRGHRHRRARRSARRPGAGRTARRRSSRRSSTTTCTGPRSSGPAPRCCSARRAAGGRPSSRPSIRAGSAAPTTARRCAS